MKKNVETVFKMWDQQDNPTAYLKVDQIQPRVTNNPRGNEEGTNVSSKNVKIKKILGPQPLRRVNDGSWKVFSRPKGPLGGPVLTKKSQERGPKTGRRVPFHLGPCVWTTTAQPIAMWVWWSWPWTRWTKLSTLGQIKPTNCWTKEPTLKPNFAFYLIRLFLAVHANQTKEPKMTNAVGKTFNGWPERYCSN